MRHLLKGVLLASIMILVSACNLQTGTPAPPPTPDAPQVEFLAPDTGDQITENTELDIHLVARDVGIGVARIELMIDDLPYKEVLPLESAAVPVFTVTMNWRAEGIGLHSMTAVAYRPDGMGSPPVIIAVEVLAEE